MEHLLSRRAVGVKGSRIRELLALTEQPHMLSLAGGLPAPEAFPVDLINRALTAAMSYRGPTGPTALQYAPTEGVGALREVVASMRGVAPDDVLVTTGAQQSLDLLARVLFDDGDVVVSEDPSYLGALQAFRIAGADVVGVHGDRDGLDVDDLADRLERGLRPKAVYVVVNFHNPTGYTLAASRRHRLVELAGRYGFVVIEDDPYGELRFRGTAVESMVSPGSPVIGLGTASKILAPGLRVGWMIAPAPIRAAATRVKQAADLHTSSLNQLVVVEALGDADEFARHLTRARRIYEERATAAVGAARRHLGSEVDVELPDGGMFLWADFGAGVDADVLLERAIAQGVAFVPGSAFGVSSGDLHRGRARFSYATLDVGALDEAFRRLAAAMD